MPWSTHNVDTFCCDCLTICGLSFYSTVQRKGPEGLTEAYPERPSKEEGEEACNMRLRPMIKQQRFYKPLQKEERGNLGLNPRAFGLSLFIVKVLFKLI